MAHWTRVASVDAVRPGEPLGIEGSDHDVALYKVGEEIFATDNFCTHGFARLCDGLQEDHVIECPMHQGRFDVRTGRCVAGPVTDDLRVYPVRVVQGFVEVLLENS